MPRLERSLIMKKMLSLLLAIIFIFNVSLPSFAANDTPAESLIVSDTTVFNGDRIIVANEGTLTDTIVITNDGRVFINDKEVTFTANAEPVPNEYGIMPANTLYRYFSTTPIIGNASDYTKYVSSQLNISVEFEQAIVNLTRTAITLALIASLGLTAADDVMTCFDAVSLAIKSYAVDNAPAITRCSYNKYVYEHSTQSTALNRLYKTDLSYYVNGVYTCSKTYYENYFYN